MTGERLDALFAPGARGQRRHCCSASRQSGHTIDASCLEGDFPAERRSRSHASMLTRHGLRLHAWRRRHLAASLHHQLRQPLRRARDGATRRALPQTRADGGDARGRPRRSTSRAAPARWRARRWRAAPRWARTSRSRGCGRTPSGAPRRSGSGSMPRCGRPSRAVRRTWTPRPSPARSTRCQPSLIRIEADEVTYNLHIIIRYEMEKAMVNGDVAVESLPRMWNEKYQEYLGITPPTDCRGHLAGYPLDAAASATSRPIRWATSTARRSTPRCARLPRLRRAAGQRRYALRARLAARAHVLRWRDLSAGGSDRAGDGREAQPGLLRAAI